MEASTLRSWWWHRQGLDGSLRGAAPADALLRSGWARSVGGAGPYLSIFSRTGSTRQAIDDAAARAAIHELPTARGCTYVLPAEQFALGLKVGETFAEAPMRVARSLDVTDKEIENLSAAVLKAVTKSALGPDEIRAATGDASRSLGEAGKKKGVSTTLPLALGLLQSQGKIRRVPENGRLDQQRYRYVKWPENPLAKYKTSLGDAFTELATRYFRWVGPATIGEFQWFSGLGVKAAKEAVAPLGLIAAATGSDRMLLPADVDAFRAHKVAKKPEYALVSSLDAMFAARRELKSMIDEEHLDREVMGDRAKQKIGSVVDLPHHAILDRGRIAGFWEYDVEQACIVWAAFAKPDNALKETVSATEAFVRDQLGDARSFSLDSVKSREPRLEWLRKMSREQSR